MTGYRKGLYDELAKTNLVDFVGSQTSGQMADNHHEGHPGFEIDAIVASSEVGILSAANIILVHAGTNDVKNQDYDVADAPSHLENMIDVLYMYSPDATILVCQIIPASPANYPGTVSRIPAFNAAIPGIVEKYVEKGKKMVLVDMHSALNTADLADGLHPNDGGYAKMVTQWYNGILEADAKGWIIKPGTPVSQPPGGIFVPGGDPAACKPTPSWYKVGQIADGASVYVACPLCS